jgi:hypothetical protein
MAESRTHSREASHRTVVRSGVAKESALESLRVIRETMEHSAAFTAVSGKGLVLIGLTALATSVMAARHSHHFDHWMLQWFKEGAVAIVIVAVSFGMKARRTGALLLSGPGRKLLLGLLPALLAGAILTGALYVRGMADAPLVPGAWLLLYGVGVVAGGAHSIRILPVMGALFMALGLATLASPTSLINGYMAAGFGGLHLVFGAVIAKKYGG